MKILITIIISLICFASSNCLAQKMQNGSGSGILLSPAGLIATNFHVVKNATKIEVSNNNKSYEASVLKFDEENDLAILKVHCGSNSIGPSIPFLLKMSVNVGQEAFTMGYPQIDIQGSEIKVTDGIISSKTGFQNDNKSYQISAPIQPGNSGGPLFDFSGNLIGITSAGIPSADNVGYAIKITYLNNLIDQIDNFTGFPENNSLLGYSFTDKIKALTPFVFLVKVQVPECDVDGPSEKIKQLTNVKNVDELNAIFEQEGEIMTETSSMITYKYQFCGNEISNSIIVSFMNNRLHSVVKSFSNSLISMEKKEVVEKKLRVNTPYKDVCEIFSIQGDLKTFIPGGNTQVFEWKLATGECYLVTFLNNRLQSHTKNILK
jgi:hypothetical protein